MASTLSHIIAMLWTVRSMTQQLLNRSLIGSLPGGPSIACAVRARVSLDSSEPRTCGCLRCLHSFLITFLSIVVALPRETPPPQVGAAIAFAFPWSPLFLSLL
jgi:hypothetical protein